VFMETQGFKFARLFYQYPPALAWRKQEVLIVDSKEAASFTAPGGTAAACPPAPAGAPAPPAYQGEVHPNVAQGKVAPQTRKRSARREKSSTRDGGGDDGGDEEPSWSSDEDSESGWSDSSNDKRGPSRSRSKRRSSKSKSKKKSGRYRAPVTRRAVGETDSSLGNPKLIHGMAINSDELTASLAPEGMSLKDGEKLFEVGVDVLGLPGMYRAKMDDHAAEVERSVMATTGLIQAAMGRRNRDPMDTMWRSSQRAGLDKVKTPEDLDEMIDAIEEMRESVFEQQDDQIYTFLSSRNYPTEDITQYQESGGLPIITRATYRYYFALLNQIRQRYHAAPKGTNWKQTQGYGIWDYYNSKFLSLRGTSNTKKHFILKVYACLREANEKKFYEASMAKYLWNYVTTLHGDSGQKGGGGGGGGGSVDRCSHCRHKALHTLLKREHQKSKCPFKDLSQAVARKAAPKGLALMTANPNLSISDMVNQAKAAVQDET